MASLGVVELVADSGEEGGASRAAARREGRRREKVTRGRGARETDVKLDRVAPWKCLKGDSILTVATDTGCCRP